MGKIKSKLFVETESMVGQGASEEQGGLREPDSLKGRKAESKTSQRPPSRIVVSEKLLERKMRVFMKSIGGESRKQHGGQVTGLADRILLAPPGLTWFAEFKTTGEELTPKQEVEKRRVERMGFVCFVIDDHSSLIEAQNVVRQGVDKAKGVKVSKNGLK